jgi:hypothetical protein
MADPKRIILCVVDTGSLIETTNEKLQKAFEYGKLQLSVENDEFVHLDGDIQMQLFLENMAKKQPCFPKVRCGFTIIFIDDDKRHMGVLELFEHDDHPTDLWIMCEDVSYMTTFRSVCTACAERKGIRCMTIPVYHDHPVKEKDKKKRPNVFFSNQTKRKASKTKSMNKINRTTSPSLPTTEPESSSPPSLRSSASIPHTKFFKSPLARRKKSRDITSPISNRYRQPPPQLHHPPGPLIPELKIPEFLTTDLEMGNDMPHAIQSARGIPKSPNERENAGSVRYKSHRKSATPRGISDDEPPGMLRGAHKSPEFRGGDTTPLPASSPVSPMTTSLPVTQSFDSGIAGFLKK